MEPKKERKRPILRVINHWDDIPLVDGKLQGMLTDNLANSAMLGVADAKQGKYFTQPVRLSMRRNK